jgi:type IV secretory pathway component VirB8
MYRNVRFERVLYLILCVINIITIAYTIFAVYDTYQIKQTEKTFVVATNFKQIGDAINIKHLDQNNQPILNIIQFFISKYVQAREELVYDESKAMSQLQIKYNVIKQMSSENVFEEYYKTSQSNAIDSNISMILNDIQRIITIDKIVFIDNDNKEIKMSNILSQIKINSIPRYVKVYFSLQSTDTKYNNKKYVADISYSFFINRNTQNISNREKMIEFNVNDYKVSTYEAS